MPVFNQFISTRPKSRRQKEDLRSTAGAAKVSSGGGKSRGELEALAARHGWAPRSLTPEDVQAMGADEIRYHEIFNSVALERALSSPAISKHTDTAMKQWHNKRLWDDTIKATPEELERIQRALDKFKQTYPQFIQSNPKNGAVLLWLKDRNMEVTFANLQTAFEDCVMNGAIHLNPSAIALGSQTDVSGDDLKRHHNFDKLIQPQQRVSDLDRLSADEYLAANKDILADTRKPPIIAAREARANATAAHFAQAEANTAKSGSTSVTDYPDDQTGYPAAPTKYSFRKLLNSLDSVEYARRLREDPAFAKAVDSIDSDGNK